MTMICCPDCEFVVTELSLHRHLGRRVVGGSSEGWSAPVPGAPESEGFRAVGWVVPWVAADGYGLIISRIELPAFIDHPPVRMMPLASHLHACTHR